MTVRLLSTSEDFAAYDRWVRTHTHGSLWQSLEWKGYQEALGREVRVYVSGFGLRDSDIAASAMVVIDRTRGGWGTWDMPRGPLAQESIMHFLVSRIVSDAKKCGCLCLFLSPTTVLPSSSFHLSSSHRHEQPTATRVIDLTKTDDELLAQMHQKGRYNIRVAQKHGIYVEESRDVDTFYALLQETAERDGFRILPLKAYKAFLECLPGSFLLLAYEPPPRGGEGCGGKPLAGLLGVVWGQTGIYYYGASSYAHRAFMAPYALQWEAMRRCKERGCMKYDLLGVTPPEQQRMPLNPLSLTLPPGGREFSHPWAGVSAFKEKFGGTVVTYPPEQQIVLRPILWRMLRWKRWIVG